MQFFQPSVFSVVPATSCILRCGETNVSQTYMHANTSTVVGRVMIYYIISYRHAYYVFRPTRSNSNGDNRNPSVVKYTYNIVNLYPYQYIIYTYIRHTYLYNITYAYSL